MSGWEWTGEPVAPREPEVGCLIWERDCRRLEDGGDWETGDVDVNGGACCAERADREQGR